MEYGRLVVLGYSSYRVAMTKPSPTSSAFPTVNGLGCRSPVGVIGTPELAAMRKAEKERRVVGQMWEPIGDQNAQYALAKRPAGNGVKLRRFHHVYLRSSSSTASPSAATTNPKAELKHATKRMLHAVEAHAKAIPSSHRGDDVANTKSFFMCVPMNDTDAHASVTEYVADETTDMFQIGRMPCKQNDVVIPGPRVGASGTISRFAARILCYRDAPSQCRIYAGGFDASRRMSTAGHALKRCFRCGEWLKRVPSDHRCIDELMMVDATSNQHDEHEVAHIVTDLEDAEQVPIDGLTKNGVRVWLPEQRKWFEVSVNGNLYEIASRTASPPSTSRRSSANPETSVRHSAFNRPAEGVASGVPALLTNGAIIDLGGVQLQFQSRWSNQTAGEEDNLIRASMSMLGEVDGGDEATAASKLDQLNVQCPVQLHTLRFRRSTDGSDDVEDDQVPYVFPACGHVFGYERRIAKSKTCPLCRHAGNFVPLLLKENFQLVSRAERHAIPECVFNPCGHAISQGLAAHYAALLMPNGRAICPFCAVHLDTTTPFSRLYMYSESEPDTAPSSTASSSSSSPLSAETAEL